MLRALADRAEVHPPRSRTSSARPQALCRPEEQRRDTLGSRLQPCWTPRDHGAAACCSFPAADRFVVGVREAAGLKGELRAAVGAAAVGAPDPRGLPAAGAGD